ncbi:MAG: hypothetical protein EXS10_01680 [Phycisphaerales bacterium]|nr:hypothetical protein [Phycisphaerales bacterium]
MESEHTLARMSPFDAQITAYETGSAIVRRAAEGLSAAQLNTRIAPGLWSIQEVIVHLLDSDLASTHRMRRIVAEQLPLLIAYDENAFIEQLPSHALDLAVVLELFEVNRRCTAQWLRTLPADAFAREGVHTQRGKISLLFIVEAYSKHVDHHMKFVDGKRAALLAR